MCIYIYREGNGNPLQHSCLENPRDRGAWWAAVYGVAQSCTRLMRLSRSSSMHVCVYIYTHKIRLCGSPGGSVVKNSPANARDAKDVSLIPGLGTSPGEGTSNPLQYSLWENPFDRGTWPVTVHGVTKDGTRIINWAHTHAHKIIPVKISVYGASLVAQLVKNPPATWETWVRSLGWEETLQKGKATHSSILAWRIPWTL